MQRLQGTPVTPTVAKVDSVLSTGTLMIVVPVLLLYLFAQKGFVESLSSSGIKM